MDYLNKLTLILSFGMIAFFIAIMLYKIFIPFLIRIKAGQEIREADVSGQKAKIFQKLHAHKWWTPTMGWVIFLAVTLILVVASWIMAKLNIFGIQYSLFERSETYIILFAFFSMGILGMVDDILNIKWVGKIKWLTAKMKLVWMFSFSAFISYWMYAKLGVDYINLWPIDCVLDVGVFYFIFTFILTVAIVNAVNITDWLDGLAWGTSMLVLFGLAIMTFFQWWFLATTILVIVMSTLAAFLRYNINPAKIFMGDSGTLALGGLISSVVYLLGIKLWIWIIFAILFLIFLVELFSSFLQIFWKKFFKRKLFPIAPFHHYLEHKWQKEYNIVMKMWLVQGILLAISLILFFYQTTIFANIS